MIAEEVGSYFWKTLFRNCSKFSISDTVFTEYISPVWIHTLWRERESERERERDKQTDRHRQTDRERETEKEREVERERERERE